MQLQPAVCKRIQRRHDHLRAEVRTADADVDDVADAAGGRVAHLLDVGQQPVEDFMHLVAERRRTARGAQRGVQHGATFGVVDRLAGQHRVAPLLDLAFAGQRQQQAAGLGVPVVLRQVSEHFRGAQRERFGARGVVGEGGAQIEAAAALGELRGQRGPGGGLVTTRSLHGGFLGRAAGGWFTATGSSGRACQHRRRSRGCLRRASRWPSRPR